MNVTGTGGKKDKLMLEESPTYVEERKLFWPISAPYKDKLYGDQQSQDGRCFSLNIFMLTCEGGSGGGRGGAAGIVTVSKT